MTLQIYMRTANEDLRIPFRDFLIELVRNDEQHARFLNMLSMLEQRGSRKIKIARDRNDVAVPDINRHLKEETGHARLFRRQAEQLLGRALKGYTARETMCVSSAHKYFANLDHNLTSNMSPETAYLWVTFIVEQRALLAYGIYQKVLVADGDSFAHRLGRLINEEKRHLTDMESQLGQMGFDVSQQFTAACVVERRGFETLFAEMQRQLPPRPNAAYSSPAGPPAPAGR